MSFRFFMVFLFNVTLICTSFMSQCFEDFKQDNLKKPIPIFKQEYDWIGLNSDEWLKGDIIAMYDEDLEFDSDELGIVYIDIDDISELRSKGRQSIRLEDGRIIEGRVVISNGVLTVKNSVETLSVPVIELLSIASSSDNEWDLWDGEVNLGFNLRGGNSEQLDYTLYNELQRRTSTSRFKSTFTSNFSESKNQDSGKTEKIANSQRLTAYYDWFFSHKVFLRAVDFEYFSDEFQNVKHRYTLGFSMGYHFVDTKKVTWDMTLGPSYQRTTFNEVESSTTDENNDTTENSGVILLGSEFEYEFTKDIDFEFNYQIQFVNEEAGKYIHHINSSLEVELINNFDLDLSFYLDRIDKPQPDEDGELPEKDDYRFVVGVSYDF